MDEDEARRSRCAPAAPRGLGPALADPPDRRGADGAVRRGGDRAADRRDPAQRARRSSYNRVAGQSLQRVGWIYTNAGPEALVGFLQQLGRVRANDIRLESDDGRSLFISPPPTYKQGRDAPAWYTGCLVTPPLQRQVIALPGGG